MMKTRMNVITMQFLDSRNETEYEGDPIGNEDGLKDMLARLLLVLREDRMNRLENVREFITEEKLAGLARAVAFFLRHGNKGEKEDDRQKCTHEGEKVWKENLEKMSRKLSEAMMYIDHLKQKIAIRDGQLTRKDLTITALKKQCESWKQKLKKSKTLRQLSESSSSLLKNIQIFNLPYHKPEQLQLIIKPEKQNIFSKTAYECSHPRSHPSPRNNSETAGESTKPKRKPIIRQLRKTFQRVSTKNESLVGGQLVSNGVRMGIELREIGLNGSKSSLGL